MTPSLLIAEGVASKDAVNVPVCVATICDCQAAELAKQPGASGAIFVRLKLAGVATPATVAVTAYVPVVPFAVKGGSVATPLAFVMTVSVANPEKDPLGPLDGAVKVTATPLTGLLLASLTVAVMAVGKFVFTVALCTAPAVAVMLAGGPAETALFVRI